MCVPESCPTALCKTRGSLVPQSSPASKKSTTLDAMFNILDKLGPTHAESSFLQSLYMVHQMLHRSIGVRCIMKGEELQHWGRPRVILVATNLADRPGLILQAISQARKAGARILLVHVLRPASLRTSFEQKPESLITTSRAAAAWDVIHRASKLIEWQGIPCEPLVVEGNPLEEIQLLVRGRGVDRVLVATRSAHGLTRLIEGSVAEAVMISVSVPVCVIGPRVITSPFLDRPGGRVLLAFSLLPDGAIYLRFASELARTRGATLVIAHFISLSGLHDAERIRQRQRAQEDLARVVSASGISASEAEVVIREGDPVEGILQQAVCPSRDFIVTGAPSLSTLSKLLGSSSVHRVIADAECPVITVPAKTSDEEISYADSGENAATRTATWTVTATPDF
jgi:nucleotide-binding universal stress UspA family protein